MTKQLLTNRQKSSCDDEVEFRDCIEFVTVRIDAIAKSIFVTSMRAVKSLRILGACAIGCRCRFSAWDEAEVWFTPIWALNLLIGSRLRGSQ